MVIEKLNLKRMYLSMKQYQIKLAFHYQFFSLQIRDPDQDYLYEVVLQIIINHH